MAANYAQTQYPQTPTRPFNNTTILEQRKARRTVTSLPENRFLTGWMCQRYPSVPQTAPWCFPRATAEWCGLCWPLIGQTKLDIIECLGIRDLIVFVKRILLHHVSHIMPDEPLFLFLLWYLLLYLSLDTRWIILCGNIVDQLSSLPQSHSYFWLHEDCCICWKVKGKAHKHCLACKISINVVTPKSIWTLKPHIHYHYHYQKRKTFFWRNSISFI